MNGNQIKINQKTLKTWNNIFSWKQKNKRIQKNYSLLRADISHWDNPSFPKGKKFQADRSLQMSKLEELKSIAENFKSSAEKHEKVADRVFF